MANGSFSLGRAFGEGWQAFTRKAGMAIFGLFVWAFIYTLLGHGPYVGLLAQLIVMGPFVGGLCVFTLHLLRQANPLPGDVFAGGHKFRRYLGLNWLLFVSRPVRSRPSL